VPESNAELAENPVEVSSVCVNCQHQNKHEIDQSGRATVTCEQCSTQYSAQTYQVRAKGGRRDRQSGIKHYSVRVKEPDREETLLVFDSDKDIEMRSGDWITASYLQGTLKYLVNHTIHGYWDVMPKKSGCLGMVIIVVLLICVVGVVLGLGARVV